MKNNPLISIITVSYNAVSTIEETIKSVVEQTYMNLEYIIIDGGSTDGTIEIINKYSNKISYWVSESDKGIYDAMNKGILKAKGKYIQFLNSSDRLYNDNIIQLIIDNLPNNESDVIYGDIIMEKEFGNFHMQPLTLDKFITTFPIYHPSTWVKRELLIRHPFDTNYKVAADFNFFRNLYLNKMSFYYLPVIFTLFEGINGVSSKNKYRTWIEKQKIIGNNKSLIIKHFWNIKFTIKTTIMDFIKKMIPIYCKKHEYNKFIKDERVIKEITNY